MILVFIQAPIVGLGVGLEACGVNRKATKCLLQVSGCHDSRRFFEGLKGTPCVRHSYM